MLVVFGELVHLSLKEWPSTVKFIKEWLRNYLSKDGLSDQPNDVAQYILYSNRAKQ